MASQDQLLFIYVLFMLTCFIKESDIEDIKVSDSELYSDYANLHCYCWSDYVKCTFSVRLFIKVLFSRLHIFVKKNI